MEFAITASVFLGLLLGGIEFGRYFFTLESLRTATADSARATLVTYNASGTCPSASTVKTAVLPRTPLLSTSSLTLTVACSKDSADRVTIAISSSYTFSSGFPVVSFLNSTLTESASLVY